MGRVSVIGITTRHVLDDRWIESWWGCEIYRTLADWPWDSPNLLHNGYWVFPGRKSGRGVLCWPPTPTSTEVKEKEYRDIYLLTLRSCVAFLGRILPLTFYGILLAAIVSFSLTSFLWVWFVIVHLTRLPGTGVINYQCLLTMNVPKSH